MFAQIRAYFAAPTFEQEDQRRTAQILNTILLAVTVLLAAFVVGRLVTGAYTLQDPNFYILAGLNLALVGLWFIMRRGHLRLVSLATVAMAWLAIFYVTWNAGGPSDTGYVAFFVVIMIASLILGWRAALVTIAFTLIAGWVMTYLGTLDRLPVEPDGPVEIMADLTVIYSLVAVLIYLLVSNLRTALEKARHTNDELRRFSESLEHRVAERTQALETSAEVSRRLSTLLDKSQLVHEVVTQIQAAFGFYHVHIYLSDEYNERLIMAGGTGKAGETMLRQGHAIDIGRGLVGRAAMTATTVFVPDVTQDPSWLPNPLLPETRSETAVPILLRDRVIGVLDVQHNLIGTIDQNIIDLLEAIASQVAIALENARQVAEIEASQQRLALVISGTNDGIWDWDIPSNQVHFSPRWKEMLGYADHEISNDFAEFESRLHPDDHPRMMQAVADYLEGKTGSYEHEFRMQHKNGSYRWILVRAALERDATGRPLRMAGSHSDITERKKATEELSIFHLGFERSTSAIFLTDADGVISYVNPAFTELYGYSAQEAIGQTPRILKSGVIPQERYVYFWETLLNKGVVAGEIINKAKDGRLVHIEGSNNPILNEKEEIIGFLAMHTDITERKEAEEALQRSQDQLSQAVELAQMAYWEFNLPTSTFTLNDHFYTLLQTSAEEVGGYKIPAKTFLDKFVHPADRPLVEEKIAALPQQTDPDRTHTFEYRLLNSHGKEQHAQIVYRLEMDEQGNPVTVYGSHLDISERRKADQLRQQNERQLREAQRIARLGYWEYDPQTQMFTFSDQIYDILHTTPEAEGGYEMPAETYTSKFIHPEDAGLVELELVKAFKSPNPTYVGELEYRFLKADGAMGYAYITLRAEKDENGRTVRLYGTGQDITERKQAEETVREAQERVQTVLEAIAVPMVISLVSDGTVAYVNEPLAEIIQIPREELLGQITPDFYYNPADRQDFLTALRATGFVSNYELHLKRGNGEDFWALASGKIINYQNQPALLTTLIDISERRKAQEISMKRALELETVAEVSAAAAAIRETDVLLQQVVDLTKARFNLYHAHIYLLDDAGINLVLAKGAGEIGQQMVAEGRSIPLNQRQSLVAQAARSQQGVIVNDVRKDPAFLAHPLLPKTRAEMAVPMLIGSHTIGVIDVQADHVEAFSEEDISIYTVLAAQVAIALENARSFEQSEKAMSELNALTQRLARESWEEYLDMKEESEGPEAGYVYDLHDIAPITHPGKEMADLQKNGNGVGLIMQPLTVHGTHIGHLAILSEAEKPDEAELDGEAVEIMAAIAEQLSARLENLRLSEQTELALAQTEQQARRLALLNDMAAALNEAQEIEDMFQIAAEQTLQIVRGDRVLATLLNDERDAVTIVATSGVADPAQVGTVLPLMEESELATAVAQHRVIRSLGTTETVWPAAIIAPLIASNRVLGTLNIGSQKSNAFDQNDENLLRQVAALLASTIENRRLFDETEDRAEQLAAINRVAQTLSQYLDQTQLLEVTHEQVKQVIALDTFFIGFYNAESNTMDHPLIYEAGIRTEQTNAPLSETSYSKQAMDSGKPVLVHLTREEANAIQQDSSRIIGSTEAPGFPVSLIYVPLVSGQRTLGVMSVQSYQHNAYTQSEVTLLEGIGRYLTVTLENVRFFQQTQERARREQVLREITARVRGSADVDTVMRTAVQEIGRTLGRKAFIQLETLSETNAANSTTS